MTQQEHYHRGYDDTSAVPAPRDGEHDDVVVGTAHAPHHEDPEDGEAAQEAYPAGTYASGSADADADADEGAEVVDHDAALEHERTLDDERSLDERGLDERGLDERDDDGERAGDVRVEEEDARADAPYDDDARTAGHDFESDARDRDAGADTDAVYEDADRTAGHDADHGVVTSEDAAAAQHLDREDAADVRRLDREDAADVQHLGAEDVEDERDEEAVAEAEEAEEARWEAEHDDEAATTGADEVADETVVAAPVATATDTDADAVDTDADAETAAESVESRPGSVDVTAVGGIWADGAVDGLRDRWRALQLRFIDDPRAVAGEADELVGEALDTITNSLQAQRRELAAWQGEQGDDTERLRAAVRAYRDYLDRLLGM